MSDLLIERIRNILIIREIAWIEKKMMGGITFMVDDKMCLGTLQGGLLCRIDPQERDKFLEETDAEIIKQGGREMKGYVHLQSEGYETDHALEFWVDKCLAFNPKAKSSKKRKKK
ncbi:MAG: TfoX/Sxy family protein [Saprospiraceae bacterium]